MKRFPVRMLMILLCMIVFCASAQAKNVPYTTKLSASEKIYHGHGEAYGYAKKVGVDGVYTIVEEAYDQYGNLWGRLKSGAGWVMLETGEAKGVHDVPYTIKLKAEDDICKGPGYSYGYLKEVGKDGVYTIVEEVLGDDGFLWGRLKSGAGWVRTTDAPMESPEVFSGDSYTVALDAWVPLYDMPSEMDGACVGIIGEDGIFTIVKEVLDDLGNVWGKLKSGDGWVNLNYVRFMGKPPITAYFADVVKEIDEERCDCTVDNSEHMVRIAFRANEPLNNVRFTSLQYGDVYEVGENHYWTYWMEEDTYFVAGVVFYGDMTTYGISFTDERGEQRYYAVSLSGMNGALVMNEYVQ